MAAEVVGALLAAALATDRFLVIRAGEYRELLMSAVGIDHQTQATLDGVTTVRFWRSTDESVQFGQDLVINQGTNGTGGSLPAYQGGQEYSLDIMVRFEGIVWVYVNATPSTGNAPRTADVIHANWERVQIGGLDIAHDPEADYTLGESIILIDGLFMTPNNNITASQAEPVPYVAGSGVDEWRNILEVVAPTSLVISTNIAVVQGGDYYVDCTNGGVTLTVGANVFNFTVQDFADTFTNANQVTINVGTDQFTLGQGQRRGHFRIVRSGTTFRIYGSDGVIAEANI
ncbi:MAG: hypothetical protein HRU18_06700 [Pseudoalteromonas sp.]|uniref:hypothetical protein n=1 Tax=Pseudoalteromonas sp. TaxID=53249 RepID=UPI001E027873|nr:hypothetical protein [Pseudoalteromonas sp.]NRA77879.1 hypothetical protein [Pseudoalteromonas sp.]